jgi:hypothetical protein
MSFSIAKSSGRYEHTFEDPDSGGEVVDSSRRLQGSCDDRRGWHKIVRKGIIEVTLYGTTAVSSYVLAEGAIFRRPYL